jgi:hypothetical protein
LKSWIRPCGHPPHSYATAKEKRNEKNKNKNKTKKRSVDLI